MPLGPAGVHAQEHLGPVARLGAAGAGLDRDEGVAASCGPLSIACSSNSSSCFSILVERRLELGLERGVFLGEFGQRLRGRRAADCSSSYGLSSAVERLELLDGLWAFSWLSQKVGWPIWSVELRRAARSCRRCQRESRSWVRRWSGSSARRRRSGVHTMVSRNGRCEAWRMTNGLIDE